MNENTINSLFVLLQSNPPKRTLSLLTFDTGAQSYIAIAIYTSRIMSPFYLFVPPCSFFGGQHLLVYCPSAKWN